MKNNNNVDDKQYITAMQNIQLIIYNKRYIST